jgi:anti-anti-sigma factor
MLNVQVLELGEVAVLHCKGRIVRSEAAFTLRDMVTANQDKNTIVLDLSEVESIEGGGLGMLVFLGRWTADNGIELKLFHPSTRVCQSLNRSQFARQFETLSDRGLLRLLGCSDTGQTIAPYLAA